MLFGMEREDDLPDLASVSREVSELLLSESEKRVLELYDRLQQLQLEVALLTAQKDYASGRGDSDAVEAVQNDLLDSRARYTLRNEVVESILTARPVIQAVHNGTNASPIERDLLPVLIERDSASTTFAHQSTSLSKTLQQLSNVESQSLQIGQKNVQLASQLLSLAEEAKTAEQESITNPRQLEEIARLERDVKASRQRWRVMKGTASAIVAGSGVDWVRDEELRSIVLDEDEDGV